MLLFWWQTIKGMVSVLDILGKYIGQEWASLSLSPRKKNEEERKEIDAISINFIIIIIITNG